MQVLGARKNAIVLRMIRRDGVEAGRAGGFGLVVGVDRVGQADALHARGADVVVTDLSELLQQQ